MASVKTSSVKAPTASICSKCLLGDKDRVKVCTCSVCSVLVHTQCGIQLFKKNEQQYWLCASCKQAKDASKAADSKAKNIVPDSINTSAAATSSSSNVSVHENSSLSLPLGSLNASNTESQLAIITQSKDDVLLTVLEKLNKLDTRHH